MHNKVKIVDFNRYETKVEEAEKKLADLMDQGYSLVSQSENQKWISFTLVKRELDVGFHIGTDGQPPAYALLNTRITDATNAISGGLH